LDPARLIFIDESSAKTNLTRLRGRSERGQRVHSTAPHGHWNSTTVIGAMRMDGSTACMAVEGATDVEVFTAYVRQILGPFLKPGDLVVMDNLAAHKSEAILALIRQTGAEAIFLPAYSRDLNPIEKMWSKLKNILRTLEARTKESLMTAIGQALGAITPQDAINWFASCGYNFI
jgi:transposase